MKSNSNTRRDPFMPMVPSANWGKELPRASSSPTNDGRAKRRRDAPALSFTGFESVQESANKKGKNKESNGGFSKLTGFVALVALCAVAAGAGKLISELKDDSSRIPVNEDGRPIEIPQGPPVLTLAPLGEAGQTQNVPPPAPTEQPAPTTTTPQPAAAPTEAPTTTTSAESPSGQQTFVSQAGGVACTGALVSVDIAAGGFEFRQIREQAGGNWGRRDSAVDQPLWEDLLEFNGHNPSSPPPAPYSLQIPTNCTGL